MLHGFQNDFKIKILPMVHNLRDLRNFVNCENHESQVEYKF